MHILDCKTVKTRKQHHCHQCGRLFEIGSKMESFSAIDDGPYTIYTCGTCVKIRSIEGAVYRDLWDNTIPEHAVMDELREGQTPENYLEQLLLNKAKSEGV